MEMDPKALERIIKKRRSAVALRQGYVDLVLRTAVIALAAWLLFTQVFLLTQAHGSGMFPAVKDGDLLFAYRLETDYAKNDVVIFRQDGQRRIGRVLARATDIVTLSDSGTLLVNGTVQTGEIIYPTYAKPGIEYPYHVPEGHVFVLGDYRTQTEDSRDFGPIPLEAIEGKVITLLRRRGM